MVNWSHKYDVIVVVKEVLHQQLLRGAQGTNKTIRIDTINTKGGGCIRRRYNILEKRNSSRNPTLKNVEFMDGTTCLNINVAG